VLWASVRQRHVVRQRLHPRAAFHYRMHAVDFQSQRLRERFGLRAGFERRRP
jgi:predicted AAA+ superfamily ATPase